MQSCSQQFSNLPGRKEQNHIILPRPERGGALAVRGPRSTAHTRGHPLTDMYPHSSGPTQLAGGGTREKEEQGKGRAGSRGRLFLSPRPAAGGLGAGSTQYDATRPATTATRAPAGGVPPPRGPPGRNKELVERPVAVGRDG